MTTAKSMPRYFDATIKSFDREIQFYISYLDYLAPLRRKELNFCYPTLSSTSKELRALTSSI